MLSRLEMEIVSALIFVVLFAGLWVHHDSAEQKKGFNTCEQKVTDTRAQAAEHDAQLTSQYEQQVQDAQHASDLVPLPVPRTTPVYIGMSEPATPICTRGTASVPKAEDVLSNSNGDGGRPGERDIRPGLEAFKVRYGNQLKACQLTLDDWPPAQAVVK